MHAGQVVQARPLLTEAIARHKAAVAAESRPGWQASKRRLHAVQPQFGALVAATTVGLPALARHWRQAQAALRVLADEPVAAVKAWLFVAQEGLKVDLQAQAAVQLATGSPPCLTQNPCEAILPAGATSYTKDLPL